MFMDEAASTVGIKIHAKSFKSVFFNDNEACYVLSPLTLGALNAKGRLFFI
jgi:hypothetical protein